MQVVRDWLRLRRETLRRLPWLRPALLVLDVILIGVGIVVSPVSGVVLGILAIIINELLSPVIVRRVFIKELQVQSQAVASIELKVIRGQNDDT